MNLDWVLKPEKDYTRFGLNPDHFEEPVHQVGRDHFFDHSEKKNWAAIEGLDIDYSQPITYGPLQMGFDCFFGTSASLDQPPYVYTENDRVLEEPTVISGRFQIDRTGGHQQRTWQVGPAAPEFSNKQIPIDMQRKVLELMDDYSQEDQPFFIYYPMHLVHGPLLPADEFKGKSGIGVYGDFVLQMDAYVRQIMDSLKEKGLDQDTLLIFTSDNGVSGVSDIEVLDALGHDTIRVPFIAVPSLIFGKAAIESQTLFPIHL
ncbi:sulfatase-like hydrolase/transferase [Streptococcus sp. X13SY08]|uniref:sulfatase-like hydrolase/transferase n=1 Tax=Streptococcus sp. X13SY08 TaxID=1676616 RepID=UPI00066FD2FF|nr:sulfatase-like hydrolase/transferase [Streptococcus sp. X13SY08]